MSGPDQPVTALESRIRELEVQLDRFTLRPDIAAFSAGDCTNGCTDACTHACTNGCTGTCAVEQDVINPVVNPVAGGGNVVDGG